MLQASPRVEYEDTYTFEDGAKLHVTLGGSYLLEDADGNTIVEGHDLRPSPFARDTLDIAAALASFMGHDGELYEFTPTGSWGRRYPDSTDEVEEDEWIFGRELGKWADEHSDELSLLAIADEDRED